MINSQIFLFVIIPFTKALRENGTENTKCEVILKQIDVLAHS